MKFSISILALNNLALTRQCLESIFRAGSAKDECELVLTDNGSSDGVGAYFDEIASTHANVMVIHNPKNLGFIEPNRKAFELARGTYFILLNNDTVVPTGWLAALEAPFLEHSTAALSGPDGACSELAENFHGKMGKKEYLEGSCLCMSVEKIRRIGLFSPELSGAYGEDSDLSLRCREAGYTLHWVRLALGHFRGKTSAMVPQVRQWQDANHAYARKRWAHYLRHRTFHHVILIRRAAAWGDVLLTTPLIAAIAEQRPCAEIWVETQCNVFEGNPAVKKVGMQLTPPVNAIVIDLNMAYERLTEIHICEAYWRVAEAALPGLKRSQKNVTWIHSGNSSMMDSGGAIAVHVGPTAWRSKNWPAIRFAELTTKLLEMGHIVLLVGHRGYEINIPCSQDLRGKTDITGLAATLRQCSLFIGLCSFPMHVAQAVGTSVVGLFGVTDPKHICTDGSQWLGMCGKTPSFGLRHRQPGTVAVDDGGAAIESIDVAEVLVAARTMMKIADPVL